MTPTHYDVIVAGGGSAGVAAAIAASRTGARTAIIERAGCLGGASTMRNVLTYCGLYTLGAEPRQAVFGIAEEVLTHLRARGAVSGPFRHRGVFVAFDPEAVKITLDTLCAQAGVEVRLHSFITGATSDSGRVSSLTIHDHGGAHTLTASAFVDATGECDLAHQAGAATRYGNQGAVNLGTMGMRIGGIAPGTTVSLPAFQAAIQAAKASGASHLTKTTSVLVRLPISGDLCCYLASADYDPADVRSFSRAESTGRRQVWSYLDVLRTLPGCHNAYLVATGPEFGTRESRHIEAVRRLTWAQVEQAEAVEDSIALGAWGVEWHDRATYASSFAMIPDGGVYEIPLRALTSRDRPNLFAAGRTADGDRQAGASIRVMGTAFATGQAAGVAAAVLADSGRLDTGAVRAVLHRQNAMIDRARLHDHPSVETTKA